MALRLRQHGRHQAPRDRGDDVIDELTPGVLPGNAARVRHPLAGAEGRKTEVDGDVRKEDLRKEGRDVRLTSARDKTEPGCQHVAEDVRRVSIEGGSTGVEYRRLMAMSARKNYRRKNAGQADVSTRRNETGLPAVSKKRPQN